MEEQEFSGFEVSDDEGEALEAFLEERIFSGMAHESVDPDPADEEGFEKFTERYKACLDTEKAAIETLKA